MRILIGCLMTMVVIGLGLFGQTLSLPMLAAGCGLVGVVTLFSGLRNMRGERLDVHWLDVVVVLGFGYVLWRCWASPVWDLGRQDAMLGGMAYGVYLLVRANRVSGFFVTAVVILVFASGVLVVGHTLGLGWMSPATDWAGTLEGGERFGLFVERGGMGNFHAMAGLLLAGLLLGSEWSKKKRLLIGVVALLAFGLVFYSGSRSGILSSVVGLALFGSIVWVRSGSMRRSERQVFRRSLLGVGVVVLGAAVWLGVTAFQQRALPQQEGILPEHDLRAHYWGMAIEQVFENPMVGTGARSYEYESHKNWSPGLNTIEASPVFAHNEYLQVAGDYGLVGGLLMLLLLGGCLISGVWVAYRREGAVFTVNGGGHWLGGLLLLLAGAVHIWTDFPLRLPVNMALFAGGVGLCVNGLTPFCKVPRVGVGVQQLLLVGLIFILVEKDLRSLAELKEAGVYRDEGTWVPEYGQSSVDAYEEANRISPFYKRSERLGHWYHEEYQRSGSVGMLEQALKHYKESLIRNPFSAMPRVNRANLLSSMGRFEEADKEYQAAEVYAGARDWWFEYYYSWGLNIYEMGRRKYERGDVEGADALFIDALEVLRKGSSRSKALGLMRIRIFEARFAMRVNERDYEGAAMLWEEAKKQEKPWVLYSNELRVRKFMGIEYGKAGILEWSKRKPQLAADLFDLSRRALLHDRVLTKKRNDVEREVWINKIEGNVKLLESAGFEPSGNSS